MRGQGASAKQKLDKTETKKQQKDTQSKGFGESNVDLLAAYYAVYEHHQKDENGNTIPHEDDDLNEGGGAMSVVRNLPDSRFARIFAAPSPTKYEGAASKKEKVRGVTKNISSGQGVESTMRKARNVQSQKRKPDKKFKMKMRTYSGPFP